MAAKKRSSRWWKKRGDEWEAVSNNVTVREFSETWDINPQTFSWWRHEFRCRERARNGSLVSVEVAETRPSAPATWLTHHSAFKPQVLLHIGRS